MKRYIKQSVETTSTSVSQFDDWFEFVSDDMFNSQYQPVIDEALAEMNGKIEEAGLAMYFVNKDNDKRMMLTSSYYKKILTLAKMSSDLNEFKQNYIKQFRIYLQ